MLLLAAAAIAASVPTPPPMRPAAVTARATASVRILAAATIRWDRISMDLPKSRMSAMRTNTGERQPIRLIEFE